MSITETVDHQNEPPHGLSEMCEEGDRNAVRWGASIAEREEAEATFDRFIARGWAVFRLTEEGEQGRRLTKFDAEAHGMLAIPQLVGG